MIILVSDYNIILYIEDGVEILYVFYGGCNNGILCILSGLKFVEVRTALPWMIDHTKLSCDFSVDP